MSGIEIENRNVNRYETTKLYGEKRCEVTLKLGDGQMLKGTLINISPEGLCFLCREDEKKYFTEKRKVLLKKIAVHSLEDFQKKMGRVAWVRPEENLVGVAFEEPYAEQFDRILDAILFDDIELGGCSIFQDFQYNHDIKKPKNQYFYD